MIFVSALAISVMIGAGIYLMLRRDAVKVVAGLVLLTNATVLFLVAASFGAREQPMLPVDDPRRVADPLVQALALTAIVIGFATTVLLLRIERAVGESHHTIDLEDLARAELGELEREERGDEALGNEDEAGS